jgi:2-polyprenyl-6-methoxyphenol hydroxylase-like FAD-dependent oxidoreductase
MRAVVIGAGIVGLTSGIALRRAGIDVVVCEHAPEIRAAGAGLGLWSNALAVFDELGIGEQVRAVGKPRLAGARVRALRVLPGDAFRSRQ